VKNLARLLRPNGAWLVADIPARHPTQRFVGADSAPLTRQTLRTLLGYEQASALGRLRVPLTRLSNFGAAIEIRRLYAAKTQRHVPRYFFDHFVQRETTLGHRASFPTLGELQ